MSKPESKWDKLNDLEKASVVVNYTIAAILLYFGAMGLPKLSEVRNPVSFLTHCPTCVFQLLVALGFVLMATSTLVEM